MIDCDNGEPMEIKSPGWDSATFSCSYPISGGAEYDPDGVDYTPVCYLSTVEVVLSDDYDSTYGSIYWHQSQSDQCQWSVSFWFNELGDPIEDPVEIVKSSWWSSSPVIEWESDWSSGIDDEVEKVKDKQNELQNMLEDEEEIWKSDLKALPTILLKTWTPISERVSTRNDNRVELIAPKMYQSFVDDINIWKLTLSEADRDRGEYIVIPSNWMVVPVNYVPKSSNDYQELINWREINVNNYLKTWVMSYPGTSDGSYWEVWNKVIFGHSSYWKFDEGRFKTQFQKIIELDEWEEVWVYKVQADGTFKRFVYEISESFETNPTNVWVLNPGVWSNLTLITCTPIWWIEWRWVIKAKYVNERKAELENYLYGTNISAKYRIAIARFIEKLESFDWEKREAATRMVFDKIDRVAEQAKDNQKLSDILDYFKMKLALSYETNQA